MQLNQYAIYSMNNSDMFIQTDRVKFIHKKLKEIKNYHEVKKFLKKIFTNIEKPGDTQGFNFEHEKSSLLCKFTQDETLIVLARKNGSDDISWVSISMPDN